MADVEQTQVPATGTPRWTRLAVLGLVLAALGPALMFLAGLVWGLDMSGDAVFFIVTTAIPLIAAFLVSRFGTWAKVVGIVAALLTAMGLFWTVFGLFTPASFFDFFPGLVVIPGALIAIVCCIAAIVAGRRGHISDAPVGGEQRGIRIVLTAVIVLGVLSAAMTFLSRSSEDEGAADLVISFKDFEFDEASYDLQSGSTVLVRNDDPFFHTFTIEALDIDIALGPGSEELVEIPAQAGTYTVFCEPHTSDPEAPAEDDMAAEITIN